MIDPKTLCLQAERRLLGCALTYPGAAKFIHAEMSVGGLAALNEQAARAIGAVASADTFEAGCLRAFAIVGEDEHGKALASPLPAVAAAAVIEEWRRARVVLIAKAKATMLGEDTPEGLAEEIEAGLMADLRAATAKPEDRYAVLQEMANSQGQPIVSTPTGLSAIDEHIHGLRPGRVYTIGAASGTGKTALALEWSRAMARSGRKVLYASCEMGAEELEGRNAAALSGLAYSAIDRREVYEANRPRLNDALAELSELPFETIAGPFSLSNINAAIHRAQTAQDASQAGQAPRGRWIASARQHGASSPPLGLLVVDYIQAIEVSGAKDIRMAVTAAALRCKAIAREHGIAVVMVCQLTKEATRAGGAPRLSDLREAAALENASDVVVMLWPKSDVRRSPRLVGCALVKNRQGPVEQDEFVFDAVSMRIRGREYGDVFAGAPVDEQGKW